MPALLAAASASKSMRALGTESDLLAAVAVAVDKCAATAGHAEAAERRARRVPSSSASASDRPARTHVGCMLLCAVLVAALLTPAASAVPARGAQRRARRAAALAAAQLSSGYGMQSSQLKPFGRCALPICSLPSIRVLLLLLVIQQDDADCPHWPFSRVESNRISRIESAIQCAERLFSCPVTRTRGEPLFNVSTVLVLHCTAVHCTRVTRSTQNTAQHNTSRGTQPLSIAEKYA